MKMTWCWIAMVMALTAAAAAAQDYPTRPVRIVVPTSPGGVTDALGRSLGQGLAEVWGQQVVVENRAGANHTIALDYVARSPADGHTLMVIAEASIVVNPHLYSNLSYDPQKDFAPITGLVSIHHALVANPSFPPNNVGELIELAKKKPGEINYASFGVGSTGHLNMEMLQTMAGIKLVAVQYKGATPAFTDVIGGHVPIMFVSVSTAVPPAQAGQVKILAIGSSKRHPQLPNIPTVAESGFPDFEARSWFGLFTTGGTPPEIVAKINAGVQRVFADPAFRARFLEPYMFEPITSSPAEFAKFISAESRKWGKVVRDANVKVE